MRFEGSLSPSRALAAAWVLSSGLAAACAEPASSRDGTRTPTAELRWVAALPDSPAARLRAADLQAKQARADERYDFAAEGGALRARCPAMGLALEASALGVRESLEAGGEGARFRWSAVARGSEREDLGEVDPSVSSDRKRIAFVHPGHLMDAYLNGPLGIEQSFVVEARPLASGRAPLDLIVSVDGLVPSVAPDRTSIRLADAHGTPRLAYGELAVRDARGRRLDAEMTAVGGEIWLRVHDDGAEYPVTVDPLVWVLTSTVAPSGADAAFGSSIAMSGDWAIVGAPAASTTGAAYVFHRDAVSNQWVEITKLHPLGVGLEDQFGYAVAIDGETAIVGSYWDDGFQSNGASSVRIFERNLGGPDNWGQRTELAPPAPTFFEGFGYAVGLSGDRAIVGAYLADAPAMHSGVAYVFERNLGGPNQWGVRATLTGGGLAYSRFGKAVAISNDVAVVGDPDEGGPQGRGAGYIFERSLGGPDAWGLAARLGGTEDMLELGSAVAVSGDTVLFGAPGDGINPLRGTAHVHQRDTGGPDHWGVVKRLTPDDPADMDGFGSSVALDGDVALVGSLHEKAYVFDRAAGGSNQWGQAQRLAGNDTWFGRTVALSGAWAATRNGNGVDMWSVLAVGAPCVSGSQCPTGHCVDGVCCDTGCYGGPDDCYACSVASGAPTDGICSVVVNGHACDDGGHCDGTEVCFEGQCKSQFGPTCAAAGLSCDEPTGKCVEATTVAACDGDHTVINADKSSADCSPYRCSAKGECLGSCTTTAECIGAYVCDVKGRCVLADASPVVPADGGCTCRVGAEDRTGRALGRERWIAVMLAGGVVARRMRRSARRASTAVSPSRAR